LDPWKITCRALLPKTSLLLKEFLKEHRKVEEQQATITELKKELQANASRRQKQIEALTAVLQKVSAQLAAASPSPWRT